MSQRLPRMSNVPEMRTPSGAPIMFRFTGVQASELEASRREKHNNALPISNLHDDVFFVIFKNSVRRHEWHLVTLLRLSYVCRLWRRIILNNADFWRDIQIQAESSNLDSQLKIAALCLERSRGATVSFKINHGWMGAASTTPIMPNELSSTVPVLVIENIARVRQIGARLSPHTLELFVNFSTLVCAPELEELHLSIISPGSFYDDYDDTRRTHQEIDRERIRFAFRSTLFLEKTPIFSGVFPKLRSLGFMGFYAPWDSSIYTGLRSLHLGTLNFIDPLSDFVRALGRSPQLETLRIIFATRFPMDRFQTADFLNAHNPALSPISLIHLRELGLMSVTVADLKRFFDKLLISAPISVEVEVAVYPGLPETRLVDILNVLPIVIQNSITSVEKLHLVTTRSGTHKLVFHITTVDGRSIPFWISVMDYSRVQSLEFTFQSVFAHFNKISHIELTGDFGVSLKGNIGGSSHIKTLTLHHDHNESVVDELSPGGGLESVTSLSLDDIYPLHQYVDIILESQITTLKVSRTFEQYIDALNSLPLHGVDVIFEKILPHDYLF